VRLTKLKLAGFKSFVDPTSVLLPGQLVGVVGPNGCGKSNIIDAVRWVLGESKAGALRGESMQDVIFSGSNLRKPVGRASVEMHFDNAQGRAAGQWSQYADIAVKRVLERDGDSFYYINNLHVRRRDVIDLFLGTGLGPRAYAIIEQGMISRIIEARPEELRLFLEEAAGVTKYKERRRETENRLSNARENLARVEDIRNELDIQIEKLAEQAEVARRYRELQTGLAETQNLLWLLKRNAARSERERIARDVERTTNRLEAETANLRELELKLEQARESHYTTNDAMHAAQTEMFAANGEVARLEQELAYLRDARQKLQARLTQLAAEEQQWRSQLASAETDLVRWQELLELARLRVAGAESRHAEFANRLPESDAALRQAEEESQSARRELAQAEQQLRVEETHCANAARALEALSQRRARLSEDLANLQQPDVSALESLRRTQQELDSEVASRQEELVALQQRQPEVESEQRSTLEREKSAQKQHTALQARREALVQLQSRVQQSGDLGQWMDEHGLSGAQPLWRAVHIEPGWEMALESVLRERLSAVRAADAAQAIGALADPAPASLTLALAGDPAQTAGPAIAAPVGEPLLAKLRCDDAGWMAALADWLDGVFAVEDLSQIIERRGELGHGALWVNRRGQTLSRHGVGLYAPDARTHGVLERQQEIDTLSEQLGPAQQHWDAARAAVGAAEQALDAHRERLAGVRRSLQECQQRLHAVQVDVLKLTQAQQRYQEQCERSQRDVDEVSFAEQGEEGHRRRAEAEAVRQRELAEILRQRLEGATDNQHQKDQALRQLRAAEQAAGRELQEARFSERECAAKLEEIERARGVASDQLARIAAETANQGEESQAMNEPELEQQLQAALEQRQQREASLAACRSAVEEASTALRALEEGRLKTEQGLGPLRDRIADLRLKEQAAQLNEEQYAARLAEVQADEAALADKLGGVKEAGLQTDIARLNQDITALGAVNLAALDELAAARERKGFLDSQSEDLTQAITTLEDAIRRIDRETRGQLQDTYDQVNSYFGRLFPELFGGGEARLILTGDEILDAGIQVMAQPPGKKNTTIHLLSGGEKALTAIALVFAIFQLNPAPFCLLDEVDAPLDDTNTERFCEMVKRMSQQTQFLFISHNKITMEMAHQLVGVTMQESGVSRVVEVDIEEALKLREEAAA
jgi:chromosome segregation protein